MLKEPDTETEQVVCHAITESDLEELSSSVSRGSPDVNLLLKKMDRQIFTDFRDIFD